jgi:hypothetical protein
LDLHKKNTRKTIKKMKSRAKAAENKNLLQKSQLSSFYLLTEPLSQKKI